MQATRTRVARPVVFPSALRVVHPYVGAEIDTAQRVSPQRRKSGWFDTVSNTVITIAAGISAVVVTIVAAPVIVFGLAYRGLVSVFRREKHKDGSELDLGHKDEGFC